MATSTRKRIVGFRTDDLGNEVPIHLSDAEETLNQQIVGYCEWLGFEIPYTSTEYWGEYENLLILASWLKVLNGLFASELGYISMLESFLGIPKSPIIQELLNCDITNRNSDYIRGRILSVKFELLAKASKKVVLDAFSNFPQDRNVLVLTDNLCNTIIKPKTGKSSKERQEKKEARNKAQQKKCFDRAVLQLKGIGSIPFSKRISTNLTYHGAQHFFITTRSLLFPDVKLYLMCSKIAIHRDITSEELMHIHPRFMSPTNAVSIEYL